jgi:regulator of sigma E protease
MVTYQMKVTDALGGPVAIVREAGEAAQNGIFTYVRTMALISLSLGVVNLVPFPVLDGGQIVFYAIEGIRGRPLPVAIRDRIQMIGVLALVALFLIITVKDVSMWIGG